MGTEQHFLFHHTARPVSFMEADPTTRLDQTPMFQVLAQFLLFVLPVKTSVIIEHTGPSYMFILNSSQILCKFVMNLKWTCSYTWILEFSPWFRGIYDKKSHISLQKPDKVQHGKLPLVSECVWQTWVNVYDRLGSSNWGCLPENHLYSKCQLWSKWNFLEIFKYLQKVFEGFLDLGLWVVGGRKIVSRLSQSCFGFFSKGGPMIQTNGNLSPPYWLLLLKPLSN